MASLKPLTILFQDEWLIAVDKPAGQLVHPSSHPEPEDEVTMKILRDQVGKKIRVLHRLDRPTSGVLLFALDEKAEKQLRDDFTAKRIEKTYLAVIDGIPETESWTCREPLRREPESRAQDAETAFLLLRKSDQRVALVEAKPRTGRYHQIRKHLLLAGHPIVGDYRYAGIERSDELGAKLGTGKRMLLQARALSFEHPTTRETITIKAPSDPLFESIFS